MEVRKGRERERERGGGICLFKPNYSAGDTFARPRVRGKREDDEQAVGNFGKQVNWKLNIERLITPFPLELLINYKFVP